MGERRRAAQLGTPAARRAASVPAPIRTADAPDRPQQPTAYRRRGTLVRPAVTLPTLPSVRVPAREPSSADGDDGAGKGRQHRQVV